MTVFSGAGISAESGVPTFRDVETGLWAKVDPYEISSAQGWRAHPERVWAWYLWRHHMMRAVDPNNAHRAVAIQRHDAIAALLAAQAFEPLRNALRGVSDVERITARIALRQVRPRELAGLRATLAALPVLHALVPRPGSALLEELSQSLAAPPQILARAKLEGIDSPRDGRAGGLATGPRAKVHR